MTNQIDFPRRKKGDEQKSDLSVARKAAETNRKARTNDDNLFKIHKTDDIVKKKKKKSKKKRKDDEDDSDEDDADMDDVVIETLMASNIPEGLTTLGCISEIRDFEMKMILTGGVATTVSIRDISDPYRNLLGQFADDPNSCIEAENIPMKPNTLFKVGQILPVKILTTEEQDNSTGKRFISISASINPRDIHAELNPVTVKQNCGSLVLSAAVESKEDHGYIMDLGFGSELIGFLSNDDAEYFVENHNERNSLYVGQVLVCGLESNSAERTIKLTTKPKKVNKMRLPDGNTIPSTLLLPGMKVSVKVMNKSERGLQVMVLNEHKGFVHRNQLKTVWDSSQADYDIGQNFKGYILYYHPITKLLAVSIRAKSDAKTVQDMWKKVRFGQELTGTVMGVNDNGSVIFRSHGGNKAEALKNDLSDTFIEDAVEIENTYTVGSIHKCKVKYISHIDSLVRVTLKKSLLEINSIPLDELQIGKIMKGSVVKVLKTGIILRLGFGLKGFVPLIHLADGPVSHPEKIYPVGKQAKCRIIRLDKNKNPMEVILTCKPTLLNKNMNILDNYNRLKPGLETSGVVAFVNSNGILVELFDGLRGWITKRHMKIYQIEYPDVVFKVGQIVKCAIVGSNPTEGKISLSLIGMNTETAKKNATKNVKVGRIFKNVIITKKRDHGFDLIKKKTGHEFYLPMAHLSDDASRCQQLFLTLEENWKIPEVTVFSVKSGIIVTRKPSFLNLAKENKIKTFQDFCEGDIQPAVIRDFATFGIFVDFVGGFCGLAPRKYIDKSSIDSTALHGYVENQTVMVKVLKVTSEDDKVKKVSCSITLRDVWCNKEPVFAVDIMESFHAESLIIKKYFVENGSPVKQDLLTVNVGDILSYRVMKSDDTSFTCTCHAGNNKQLRNYGIITRGQMTEQIKIGSVGEAVVLNIDVGKDHYELSICPKLLKHVNAAKKHSAVERVKVGQVIKCSAEYIANEYVLVCLAGHAIGAFAYISTRRHMNDIYGLRHLFTLGECYHIVIKRIIDVTDGQPVVIGVLKQHDEKVKLSVKKQNEKASKRKQNTPPDEVSSPKSIKSEPVGIKSETKVKVKNEIKVEKPPKPRDCLPDLQGFVWDNFESNNGLTNEDSSENESSDDEVLGKSKKSRKELKAEARNREAELRQKETLLMDNNRAPETEDDFEKLCIASPNSSIIWLKYIAYCLEKGEIEKGRTIVQRALAAISFREESEKLNIWIASLNLENMYGTQEAVNKVFQNALRYNNEIIVYKRLANIYIDSGKTELVDSLYKEMVKKFKKDKSVWIDFGMLYFKLNHFELARKLLPTSLVSLESRDHVDVISKFGQMEFKYGDKERGKSTFEGILTNYPKRIDIWSIYIDMMVKYNSDNVEAVRGLFERIITLKFPPKKMHFLYKKYMQFERTCGNDDTVARVKEKALEYINENPHVAN